MNLLPKNLLWQFDWMVLALVMVVGSRSFAQDSQSAPPPQESISTLAEQESRIAERFDRLEMLASRLAELSGSTQPRRARLLRELITNSREQDIAGRFELVIKALEEDRLANAAEDQGQLRTELQRLLELLLQEDRDRQIESERNRINKYLAELKKLIRLQRGIKARTEGGDEAERLGKDQQRAADATGKLSDQISETEGPQNPEQSQHKAAKESADESPEESGDEKQSSQGQDAPDSEDQPEDAEDKQSSPRPAQEGDSSEPTPGESKESQPNEGNSGKPSPAQPSEGEPSGNPSNSNPAEQPPEQTPAQRSTERLQQARQRMQQAREQLEQAQRSNAVEQQEQALRELEQAKAELERILRQLREEELERMLVLLEARFRKMLDEQVAVYEETQKLESTQANAQAHELEIASGRLSRKEQQIARDADRALILLREDGTSVAFPEALEQAIEDMHTVVERLANVQLGLLTQGLEEDIVATLEEILAALQQAIKELREQKAQQQQGEGQPDEQPLVDQLAELRMIRALQNRINLRTKRYGEMIEGEQALEQELLEALDQLALRQERVFQATHDLDTQRNQ